MSNAKTLGRWARPTLLGPFVPVWILITLASSADALPELGRLAGLGDRFTDEWWIAMLLGSLWTAGLVVCLAAVDIALLSAKTRALPQGGRAWLGAFLSPFAVGVWAKVLPDPQSIPAIVLTVPATFALAALSLRVLFGRRP